MVQQQQQHTQGGVYVLRHNRMLKVGGTTNFRNRLKQHRCYLHPHVLIGIIPVSDDVAWAEVKVHTALKDRIDIRPGWASHDWFPDTKENRRILRDLGMIELGVPSCRRSNRASALNQEA